jgi:hypothetical protein
MLIAMHTEHLDYGLLSGLHTNRVLRAFGRALLQRPEIIPRRPEITPEAVDRDAKPWSVPYYGPCLMAGGTHLPKPPSAEVCSRYAP